MSRSTFRRASENALFVSSLLAYFLVACSRLAAQDSEPPGDLTRGTVLAADGNPWATARVTLVARPWPEAPPVDVQRVVADAQGRVRVRLLRSVEYQAFAMTQPGEDGRYRSTEVESCQAAQRFELKEVPGGCMRVRLRLPNVPAHKYSDMRVVLQTAKPDVASVAPYSDREVLLPATPGSRVQLRVLGRDRRVLSASSSVATGVRTRTSRRRSPATPLELEVRNGRREHSLLLRVLGTDTKPVHGARVTILYRGGAEEVLNDFVSDGDGWVRVDSHTAFSGERSWLVLNCHVHAKGYRRARLDLAYQVFRKSPVPANLKTLAFHLGRDLAELRKSGRPDFTIQLAPGRTIRGRVMLDESRPVAGAALRCVFRSTRVKSNVNTNFARPSIPLRAVTKADGSFEFEGVGGYFSIEALLPHATRKAIGATDYNPVAWLVHGTAEPDSTSDLGPIDLSKLAKLTLRVRTPDGSAARSAPIAIAHRDRKIFIRSDCDRIGRLELLAPAPARYRVASRTATASIDETTKLVAGQNVIDLRSSPVIYGRVMNDRNAMLPGALLYVSVREVGDAPSLLSMLGPISATSALDGTYRIGIPAGAESGHVQMRYYARRWHIRSLPLSRSILRAVASGQNIEHDIVLQGAPDPKR